MLALPCRTAVWTGCLGYRAGAVGYLDVDLRAGVVGAAGLAVGCGGCRVPKASSSVARRPRILARSSPGRPAVAFLGLVVTRDAPALDEAGRDVLGREAGAHSAVEQTASTARRRAMLRTNMRFMNVPSSEQTSGS